MITLTEAGFDREVTVSGEDDAVTSFDREPSTGTLTFAGCLTGDPIISSCASIPPLGPRPGHG